MTRILLATALAFTCFLGTASADVTPTDATATTATPASTAGDSDCAKARKAGRACQLVFDGDTVDGQRVGGDGDMVAVNGSAGFSNLIRVRTSFRDMIIKSAQDL